MYEQIIIVQRQNRITSEQITIKGNEKERKQNNKKSLSSIGQSSEKNGGGGGEGE
jgi:hypothetical protein